MEYKKYLTTKHWKKTRQRVLHQKGRRCKLCGENTKMIIHHRYYKDDGGSILFRERNHQLVPLCKKCHRLYHAYHSDKVLKPMDYVRSNLMMDLGLTRKQAIFLCKTREVGIDFMKNQLYQGARSNQR